MSKITIELTPEEIAMIHICVSLPIIQKLWSKEQARQCQELSIFFQELVEVDNGN